MTSEGNSATLVYKDGTASLPSMSKQETLSMSTYRVTEASHRDTNTGTNLSTSYAVEKSFLFESTALVEKNSASTHNDGDRDTEKCSTSELKDKVKKHKPTILNNLNPSDLFDLLEELELVDAWEDKNNSRKELAEIVLKEVEKKQAYHELLYSIEEDKDNMGHRYIACLLRGQRFARDDDIEESAELHKLIHRDHRNIFKMIDVDALEPHLVREELVTEDDRERLKRPANTKQDKVKELLVLLKRKGPTAHSIFVHRCLALEDTHLSHKEIHDSLLSGRPQKRKAIDFNCPQKTKVPKCQPCLLELPEGITNEQYFKEIREMRRCHLIGRKMWQEAEKIYKRCMDCPNNPIEMKIAVLLESCTMYITDNKPEVVEERVKQARQKCSEIEFCNSQILEGRCEWMLAKLHRYRKDYTKADEHIKNAFHYHRNCEQGEDRALTNYCHACILLSVGSSSTRDVATAISDLKIAISFASEKDYGLDTSHCKIRFAQANVSSSSHQPPDARKVHSVTDAQRALQDVNEEDLQPRTRCMYHYTWSDIYSVAGQVGNAIQSAELALNIARQHDFKTEITSSEIRLKPLISARCINRDD